MNFNSKKIKQLAQLVHDRMGLHFTENKHKNLIKGIDRSAKKLSYTSTELFVDFLLIHHWNKTIIDTLGTELTIGETYFFRNRKIFDMIETSIIPGKIEEKSIKFWCAACSTGEEPYSIAVSLDRIIPNIKEWNINILATDINKNSLKKAKHGVYRDWSFRESAFPNKEYYFKKNDAGDFEINHKIKKMVDFSLLNLIAPGYPSILNATTNCDVILCRNVLIYFSLPQAAKVIERLYDCLKPGGLLILTATELALVPENLFELIDICGNFVLKKPLNPDHVSHLLQFNFNDPLNCEVRKDLHIDNKKNLQPKPIETKKRAKSESKTVKKKVVQTEVVKKESESHSSDERYKEAELLADRGEYDDASKICKKAIKEAPLHSKWSYLYGVVLFESDNLIEASKAISRVLYLDHGNIMANIMLGHINDARGKSHLAKKNFNNALMLLRNLNNDDIVSESGGENVERLKATIEAVYNGT